MNRILVEHNTMIINSIANVDDVVDDVVNDVVS